jgi:hypothetical protein
MSLIQENYVQPDGMYILTTGFRFYDGSFTSLGHYGAWWSSTEYDATSALFRTISFQGNDFYYQAVDNKIYGLGVECNKN